MYELSIALHYLLPRWRQLSVSIISIISTLVIALVVWLVVVFFSVTHGLEKGWIEKLIALTAPIRITPTAEYYNSYYYQIDTLSAASNYNAKSISEKLSSAQSDPYDSESDSELPLQWPSADLHPDGTLKDPVKEVFQIISRLHQFPGLKAHDFEISSATMQLTLIRPMTENNPQLAQSMLNQSIYISSLESDNHTLFRAIQPLTEEDLHHFRSSPSFSYSIELHLKEFHSANSKELPRSPQGDYGILVPKNYREAGVHIGDRGHLYYYAPTSSSMQEQQLPIYVAGYYDHGIIPLGGKFLFVDQEVTSLMRTASLQEEVLSSNGINVRFDNLDQADQIKQAIQTEFQKAGITPYWHIETYKEFEFTKDLIQQLQSERNLWTLIAAVIILVACSNIISMLIILVNDKKMEIGILRAMGATTFSIAMIFGTCGVFMGMIGSILGVGAAVVTLNHLQTLVDFIGSVQGYQMFNPIFYGNQLPNEISFDALLFVIITTSGVSLIAGIVPAIKACLLRPSAILRSE